MPQENKIFDSVLTEPARLKLMNMLIQVEATDFNYLLSITKMTKGNLAFHLTKLEDTGYINIKKFFLDKKPHTEYSITTKGQKAFREYLKGVQALIKKVP